MVGEPLPDGVPDTTCRQLSGLRALSTPQLAATCVRCRVRPYISVRGLCVTEPVCQPVVVVAHCGFYCATTLKQHGWLAV